MLSILVWIIFICFIFFVGLTSSVVLDVIPASRCMVWVCALHSRPGFLVLLLLLFQLYFMFTVLPRVLCFSQYAWSLVVLVVICLIMLCFVVLYLLGFFVYL